MKSAFEIRKDLFATLAEIRQGNFKSKEFEKYLRIKLGVLYDIFGEDIPEEYWEVIESEME